MDECNHGQDRPAGEQAVNAIIPGEVNKCATDAALSDAPTGDYPLPPAATGATKLVWNEAMAFQDNLVALGKRLAECNDIFRRAQYAGGLMLASPSPLVPPRMITK